jgi:hypothetical protein
MMAQITDQKLDEFVDYVLSFYGEGGIYPMGATHSLIYNATMDLIQILQVKNEEFCGDSIDRELVRDLLISKYNLVFPRK